MTEKHIVVIDNGASTIKIGCAGEANPRIISPNLTFKAKGDARYITGEALLSREDILSLTLRRPIDKGYLVNGDLQKEIWSKLFKSVLKIQPSECGVVITEPMFNFESSRATVEKILLQDFGFASMSFVTCPEMTLLYYRTLHPAYLSHRAKTALIVDAGCSFAHAVPICNGAMFQPGIRRIDFGGKAMTNYLKELISFRSMHLMEETYLAETIKEALCFVSQNVGQDLKASRVKGWSSPHYKEFVLPDGVTNLRGSIRHHETRGDPLEDARDRMQTICLNNERFMVPEILFHPSDIGIDQAGLPEVIVQAVEATPKLFHPLLYGNIILVGGVSQCSGFLDRLKQDVRSLVPDLFEIGIDCNDPLTVAWKGASMFGRSKDFQIRKKIKT